MPTVENGWFASLTDQQQQFSGAAEIARVGSNLRDHYPSRLQRASLRDNFVNRLGDLIFGSTMTAFYRYIQEQESQSKSQVAALWHIDPNRVIAGMSIVGMWQRRFESILEYVIQRPRKTPPNLRPRLFIDNLVALFRIGKSAQNSLTLSDVLKPYLEERSLTLIAEASPEEWNVVMETDRRLNMNAKLRMMP